MQKTVAEKTDETEAGYLIDNARQHDMRFNSLVNDHNITLSDNYKKIVRLKEEIFRLEILIISYTADAKFSCETISEREYNTARVEYFKVRRAELLEEVARLEQEINNESEAAITHFAELKGLKKFSLDIRPSFKERVAQILKGR